MNPATLNVVSCPQGGRGVQAKTPMPKTILLADDSPIIGQTLYRALSAEGGYDLCAQAADGSEAISLAKRYKPDLVILDLAMPKMSGIETARELKKIMPAVPIILLTLHATTAKELFAGDSCVDSVIPKGDFTRLMARVRTLLCAEAGEDDTQFSKPIHEE
ncbi:MAG: response regulator transcription factor [Candidatus Acidiferrales bacterium]